MEAFKIEVTKYNAEVQWVNGKPTPNKTGIDNVYHLEQPIYDGVDRNELKNEFIENASNKVRANNVMEENMVIQKRPKTMNVWIITNIE